MYVIILKVLEYRAREQNAGLRDFYRQYINGFSARQLVFFDETHVDPADLRRRYGYSFCGFPAYMYVYNAAHGRGKRACGFSAMSLRGCFSATTTTETVDAVLLMHILENQVLPQMRPFPQPESILVMDNAATRDHNAIRILCARFGVKVVFLPPYSYDFNPIEPSLHQAKNFSRSVFGPNGNTEESLFAGLASISSDDAVNYYRHCGYLISEDDLLWVANL